MIKIAVAIRHENYQEHFPFNERYYIYNCFRNLFDSLDVMPILIMTNKEALEASKFCDALIVTGSSDDVDPSYYGEEKIEGKKYDYDDFPFIRYAVNEFHKINKPILGICAGIQELNVIFGGTLFQKIEGHNKIDGLKHGVTIKKGSFLESVYSENANVNTYHSQALNKIAPSFDVTAISEDGYSEGIEMDNIVGVQWHPEMSGEKKFFEEFIKRFIK